MTYHLQSHTITFEAALRDLSSSNHKHRQMAAHALGEVTAPAERKRAAEALISALDDDRVEVQAEACLALGDLSLELAVEPLVRRLADPVPLVRQSAAVALGKLGMLAGFEPLARALREGAADLRFQAATSLVEIDAERAFEPLMQAVGEEQDGEVLGAIALALGTVANPAAIDRLTPLLEHGRKRTRFDAAYGLAQLGSGAGLEVLAACGEDPELGWDALEAIELIAPDRAADAVAPLVDTRKIERPNRMRAAALLLTSDPEHPKAAGAQQLLLAELKAWKPEHRALAVEMLGKAGGSWAVAPLRSLQRRWAGRRLHDEIEAAIKSIRERP